MNCVYVVHEVVPYEFGRVLGVFLTETAAIAYAETLVHAEELTVSRWSVSDVLAEQSGVDVWERLAQDKAGKIGTVATARL